MKTLVSWLRVLPHFAASEKELGFSLSKSTIFLAESGYCTILICGAHENGMASACCFFFKGTSGFMTCYGMNYEIKYK